MMKLFREEKTGLKIEFKEIKKILFFFFLSNQIFPQTPINGFCKYTSFKIDSSFTTILSFNFNSDQYADLLLVSPEKNRVNLYEGSVNNNFSLKDSFLIPIKISKVKLMKSKIGKNNAFVYTSRKDRKIGVFEITENGKFINSVSYKFESYPENLSIGDVDSDGKNEILISGSAFDGLSLLFFDGERLQEKKIDRKTNYTNAVFIDLNNDGFPDISAFNLLTNSIVFFYNRGDGTFRKVRDELIDERINSLNSFDMNSDSYEDILSVKNNSIQIQYNDFQSSFDKHLTINTDYYPDKFILGDFNQDGMIDIAYINFTEEILSIIYAKSENEFYPEIIYLHKKGIKDIIPFYSKFTRGISCITNNGEVFFITKLLSFSEDSQLAISPSPTAISYFDLDDYGITDLAFIDDYKNSLNILIRNNSGILNLFYSFSLFQPQSDLTVLNVSPKIKAFYCYSSDKRLIETITINFVENKINRKSIYADGNIKDLKILKDENGTPNIYALYKKEKKLGANVFEYSNNNYVLKNKIEFNAESISSSLLFNKTKSNSFDTESIYFWQRQKTSLPPGKNQNEVELIKKSVDKKIDSTTPKFSLSLNDTFNITSISGDLFNEDEDIFLSFINLKKKKDIVTASEGFVWKVEKSDSGKINVTDKSQLFIGKMRFNGLKKLFIYNPKEKIINRMDFFNKGKNFVAPKIADVINLKRYFIKNMNSKNYHLIYTSKNESFITIKNLSN